MGQDSIQVMAYGYSTFSLMCLHISCVATVVGRFEMAKFLWVRGDDIIPTAIVASRIFRGLAEKLGQHDSDMKEAYLQNGL